jgi:hypothetical protein
MTYVRRVFIKTTAGVMSVPDNKKPAVQVASAGSEVTSRPGAPSGSGQTHIPTGAATGVFRFRSMRFRAVKMAARAMVSFRA